ncbi:MAG: DUF4837 family protein [Gemmatimonadota bacterium]
MSTHRPPVRASGPLPRPAAGPAALALALVAATGACDTMELAPGELNDIYVAADAGLWSQVEDTVESALQPTVLTVTEELAFQVVYTDPTAPEWGRVQSFKQILLIGTPQDPWVAPAVAEADGEPTPPTVFQTRDVWSRNQFVTVLLLPSPDPAAVAPRLPELSQLFERHYRRWALARMFISGRDSALADTLAREAGFSLLVPEVYRWTARDSLYVFRNDNPSPDELIRQVTVTWRTPVPGSLDSLFAAGPLLAWRQALGEAAAAAAQDVDTGEGMIPLQEVDTSMVRSGPVDLAGARAWEVQAIWQNPPSADWPAAGPTITRAVVCPGQDRLYLLDAWLYAPGRDKYEYMIQLNTILDSFRCGG